MEEILFKIFPVQSKSSSGFFQVSNNTTPYTLVLTKSMLTLRFIGIPFVRIRVADITSYSFVGDEWVSFQKVFNAVVIKYKKAGKSKERAISFFDKKKSSEFLKALGKAIGTKKKR